MCSGARLIVAVFGVLASLGFDTFQARGALDEQADMSICSAWHHGSRLQAVNSLTNLVILSISRVHELWAEIYDMRLAFRHPSTQIGQHN